MRTLRVAAVVLGATLVASQASAADLDVLIETIPSGAKVEHAGQVIGETPLRLTYPKGYFETRATVWGAYLGAPLEFTFSLPGYERKMVKLGNGPHPWRNLYGQILYQYYLLDRSYRIELTPAGPAAESVDAVTQLERLAQLKAQGALTEEEFAAAKARVLASGAQQGTPAARERNYLDEIDPKALCQRISDRAFLESTLAKPTGQNRQISSAADGTGREVMASCSWQLVAPRRATLHVSVTCGERNPASHCPDGVQVEDGKIVCLWGNAAVARAAVKPSCIMEASLKEDARAIPGANPVSALDAREVVRTMAGRL